MTNRPQAEGRPGPGLGCLSAGPGSSPTWRVAWAVPPDLASPAMPWAISFIVSTSTVRAIKPGPACAVLSESDQGQFSTSRSHVASSEQACVVAVVIAQGRLRVASLPERGLERPRRCGAQADAQTQLCRPSAHPSHFCPWCRKPARLAAAGPRPPPCCPCSLSLVLPLTRRSPRLRPTPSAGQTTVKPGALSLRPHPQPGHCPGRHVPAPSGSTFLLAAPLPLPSRSGLIRANQKIMSCLITD